MTGDTHWVDVSTENYASACLGEATKMENLTRANSTEDGGTESIFDLIASSTCPRNCSGNGICANGRFYCFKCIIPVLVSLYHIQLHKV